MPNPSGRNGHPEKQMPSDEELRGLLLELSQENSGQGASIRDQIAAVKVKFGVDIGRSTFFEIRKHLEIPSVRRNPSTKQEQIQELVRVTENNISGSWGVGQTRGRLAQAGVLATRETVRDFNIDFYPHHVQKRMESTRARVPRKALQLMGPLHQLHFDGHEKLSDQALKIGKGISLSFYGGRCAWSSRVMILVLAPNVRCDKTIGHIYLDYIIQADYFVPITVLTDHGAEVGELRYIQDRLRLLGAPEIDVEAYPPSKEVPSVHNTPIEAFWSWQRKDEGNDMKHTLISGREFYNGSIPFHRHLFYWVWVPVIQGHLDKYRDFYNAHTLRKQKAKAAPTGASPNLLFAMPSNYDVEATNCGVHVTKEWVAQERARLGGDEERARLFEWYPQGFDEVATCAWESIGRPTIVLTNAWLAFQELAVAIEELTAERN